MTKDQFEHSTLFRQRRMTSVEVVRANYRSYITTQLETFAIAVQLDNVENITVLRSAGPEINMTQAQKRLVFALCCDFVFGEGRSVNLG